MIVFHTSVIVDEVYNCLRSDLSSQRNLGDILTFWFDDKYSGELTFHDLLKGT